MNYMFGPDYSCNCSQSVKTICARVQLSHRSNQLGRLIVSCDRPTQGTITYGQRAEFRAADTVCIRQHRLENGIEIVGRTADDPQHRGGRSLLLPYLGELAPACFKLLVQFGAGFADWTNTRSRLRSRRAKVATLCSA